MIASRREVAMPKDSRFASISALRCKMAALGCSCFAMATAYPSISTPITSRTALFSKKDPYPHALSRSAASLSR